MPAPIFTTADQILNRDAMAARRERYFAYVRKRLPPFFNADGTYPPEAEHDYRITFWSFPALIHTDDAAERRFALDLLAKTPGWDNWNIFVTSSILAIGVRDHDQLTPELRQRVRHHAANHVCIDRGRGASSAANDYMFHGFNDNMPAMATRALILAGELIDDAYILDRGRFLLEGLAAQFHRCGLLGEYNSATYTPITMAALADVAELAQDAELREMAAACLNRCALDLLAHWHNGVGAPVGSSSRAYMADRVQTISNANAIAWYMGLPGALDPAACYDGYTDGRRDFDSPVHHGPAAAFCIAQDCEFMVADFVGSLRPETIAYARREPQYPEVVRASGEGGRTASLQTRSYRQPLWGLGSCDRVMWGKQAGQHLTAFANWTRVPQPARYEQRGQFWAYLLGDSPDCHDMVPAEYGGGQTENGVCLDLGHWRTAQQGGSLMAVGQPDTVTSGQSFDALRLILTVNTCDIAPDAIYLNDRELHDWDGDSPTAAWHFLQFGQVFLGLRTAGMCAGRTLTLRRSTRNRMLRIELLINDPDAGPICMDEQTRTWTDLGYVLEIADAAEISFADFRAQCLAARWEFGRCFYRNTRYEGRHGELQITDSVDPNDVKVIAIDGETEPHTHFQASDLPAAATSLYKDGRRIKQRRLWYDPDFIASPFYDIPQHRIVADRPGADS